MSLQHFAVIVSEFNKSITDKLLEGALLRMAQHQISDDNIKLVKVPGAVEIPLVAKLLGQSGKFAAIICLGAVIRGETDHYDYVCQQVSQGCMQVMLECHVPVIFGVLTTNDFEQALDRVGGKEGHKGMEAVDTAIVMANIVNELRPIERKYHFKHVLS